MRIPLKTIMVSILVIVGAFLFWVSESIAQIFYRLLDIFELYADQEPLFTAAVFVFLAALSAVIAPPSSVPLVPFAVATWGETITLFLLLGGWLTGGAATYAVGRYAAHPLVKHLAMYETIDFYRKKLSARKQFQFVLLFRLAMPAEIPGYVLGILAYDFWKYLLATFVSELLTALVIVYASAALLFEERILFVLLIAAGVTIFSCFTYLFHKKINATARE